MQYDLMIGGIGFRIDSPREIPVEPSLAPFFRTFQRPDVTVDVIWDYGRAPIPSVPMTGIDVLTEYYREPDALLCLARGGWKGSLATCQGTLDFRQLTCYINVDNFQTPINGMGDFLRILPMRAILQHFSVIFFHASQIAIGERGILFTAPSGTGKTTQAKLWQRHRNARIICNDRTLVRAESTYGYPMDGSEPVRSGEVHRLGAIVTPGQNSTNTIQRLKPGVAIARLLPQLVIDAWDESAKELAMEQLLDLVGRVPVYRLECTPDISAVRCLEAALIADGVISNDFRT